MKKEDGVVFIQIGEVCASKDPVILRTLVGSCVAVCLYDQQNRVGGMSHIVFPGRADPKRVSGATRYAVNALELLINGIMGLGGDRTRLVAKIFGGGAIMPSLNSERYAAGESNIEFVCAFMDTERIRITAWDLGGHHGRNEPRYRNRPCVHPKNQV